MTTYEVWRQRRSTGIRDCIWRCDVLEEAEAAITLCTAFNKMDSFEIEEIEERSESWNWKRDGF
jgi:hypothetical protein